MSATSKCAAGTISVVRDLDDVSVARGCAGRTYIAFTLACAPSGGASGTADDWDATSGRCYAKGANDVLVGMSTLLLAGVLGVAAGWWTSLAIYRLPRGERILHSWPHCENCHDYLAGKDLVPVVSWVMLRGKCRSCAAPLGYRFLLLELGTGLLFAVLALRLGVSVALLAYLYFAAVCVALFIIDIRIHRLPDVLTLPSYIVIGVLLLLDAVATGSWGALLRALVGMVVLFCVYYALAIAAAGALGFGDVKLAGLLGLLLGWSGWYALIAGSVLGFVYGGLFSLVLLVSRRVDGKTKIAFGPFMLLGALSAVLLGTHTNALLPMLMR